MEVLRRQQSLRCKASIDFLTSDLESFYVVMVALHKEPLLMRSLLESNEVRWEIKEMQKVNGGHRGSARTYPIVDVYFSAQQGGKFTRFILELTNNFMNRAVVVELIMSTQHALLTLLYSTFARCQAER